MMKLTTKLVISMTMVTFLAGLIGCSTKELTAPRTNPLPKAGAESRCAEVAEADRPSSHMARAGETVFRARCTECHTDNGVANAPGPDLSDYGSEGWSHRRTAAFIANAQLYMPGTKMTKFSGTLTGDEIDDAAAYVMSLKQRAYYLAPDAPMLPPDENAAEETSATMTQAAPDSEGADGAATNTP